MSTKRSRRLGQGCHEPPKAKNDKAGDFEANGRGRRIHRRFSAKLQSSVLLLHPFCHKSAINNPLLKVIMGMKAAPMQDLV